MIKWLRRRKPDVTDDEVKRRLEREQQESIRRIHAAGIRHVKLLTEVREP